MNILTVIPTPPEIRLLLQACSDQGVRTETIAAGKVTLHHLPDYDLAIAAGGLGKAQFALQTQHLIDMGSWRLVICAGAAGALDSRLNIGDVVIATETVEHDIYNRIGPPLLPRFPTSSALLEYCRQVVKNQPDYRVHYGPIASGDEDVVDGQRRTAIQQLTGALAVAWEGAGGARASQFSGIPFVEIRGLTDGADEQATNDYRVNLKSAMSNVAQVVLALSDWQRAS